MTLYVWAIIAMMAIYVAVSAYLLYLVGEGHRQMIENIRRLRKKREIKGR